MVNQEFAKENFPRGDAVGEQNGLRHVVGDHDRRQSEPRVQRAVIVAAILDVVDHLQSRAQSIIGRPRFIADTVQSIAVYCMYARKAGAWSSETA